MSGNRPQRVSSVGRHARAPSWGGRLGSIPDTDDGGEDEAMDFSDAASGGEESSGGGGFPGAAAAGAPPPRRSSLPTLAEDSVGGGSRSTRTRSPSPSVGNLAGGGSRTASGVEGGSAGAFALPPQHPSSSGERGERAGGGGGSSVGEKGVFGGGIAGNAPTPPPPPFTSHSHRQAVQLSPLSHSGRWDSYFDSKRKVNVPGRGKFCVYQRGGIQNSNNSNNASSSAFASANANANAAGDTAVSPPPNANNNASSAAFAELPVVFCHHGAGYTGLSWALMAAQLGPGIRVVAYDARGHGETETADDADLSAATQAEDAAALWRTLFADEIARGMPPKTVAVGHAMGGMACVRAAAEHNGYRCEVSNAASPSSNCSTNSSRRGLVGIALIDVVLWHGGAAESAPHMMSVIAGRPPTFDSHSAAMLHATCSGRCRNPEAVAVSFASMVREDTDERGTRWVWRTPLEPSKPHWAGWYDDLASCLLSPSLSGIAKLLMFSTSRPLDRSLEVARAQGKLQVLELPLAAFAVHEDEPGSVASALREFLEYHTREKGAAGAGAGAVGSGGLGFGSGGGGEYSSSGGSRMHLADGS